MLISNWPRTRKFNRLLHLHAGKAITFYFSHCHALITLYVQFLCSDWSKFDRWVHAENLCSVWKLAYWQLELTEFCVILWCFKLSFTTWCTKWNTATVKIPWYQRFFLIFLCERDQEQAATMSRQSDEEREKPLVTLVSNLTFMKTTAVKRVKLLMKRVTNGNLANTCPRAWAINQQEKTRNGNLQYGLRKTRS